METSEKVTITLKVNRYRSSEGHPSCYANLHRGEQCNFLEDATYQDNGSWFCRLMEVPIEDENSGTDEARAIPCSDCPVWGAKTEFQDCTERGLDDDR